MSSVDNEYTVYKYSQVANILNTYRCWELHNGNRRICEEGHISYIQKYIIFYSDMVYVSPQIYIEGIFERIHFQESEQKWGRRLSGF